MQHCFKKFYYFIGITLTSVCGYLFLSAECSAMDKYGSMTELEANTVRGTDWQHYSRNRTDKTVILGPHGGGIEPGSSEVARETAEKNNAGYYTFMGTRPYNNSELHVTSAHYDEPIAQSMVRPSTRTVAFHKTGREGSDVYLGGRDQILRRNIETALEARGFTVEPGTGNIEGANLNNIVNQNSHQGGVQLEMSNSLVRKFYKNGDVSRVSRENRNNYTPTMHSFTDGVSEGLNKPYN